MGGEQSRQLAATMDKLSMSARATHRVIKMARTIADYKGSDEIRDQDLMEAISYRRCQFSKLRARRLPLEQFELLTQLGEALL